MPRYTLCGYPYQSAFPFSNLLPTFCYTSFHLPNNPSVVGALTTKTASFHHHLYLEPQLEPERRVLFIYTSCDPLSSQNRRAALGTL